MKKFKKTGRMMKESVEAEPERKKLISTPTIFAIIIIVIMVASGIGYMWEGGNAIIYNEFKFNEAGDRIYTKIDGKRIDFSTLPENAEMINASKEAFWVIKNTKMVYMTSEPDSLFKKGIASAEFELQKSLAQEGIYSVYAFTDANEFNITQVTCRNATLNVPVIYFMNSTETRITYDDGCIIMSAESDFAFTALKDRLMYGFYGIIG
ncbi:hypothetical protein COV19_07310 [Candidatus Woesearchaeota archaeon CG10_big_fil_rev_8_21_14_0_10_44_13]|nr:MAG: hypothetical protein COV19_07310 [Candidatus Woesearchaeota archaeon CG10_big_fil_rev_8_21_14_0_10_44_13]